MECTYFGKDLQRNGKQFCNDGCEKRDSDEPVVQVEFKIKGWPRFENEANSCWYMNGQLAVNIYLQW